ncbi:unnamed protein product [Heterosigma akashiwo]
MGEDTRSCMAVRGATAHQNGALLGYLLQGNVRLLRVRTAEGPGGRVAGRAVLRVLHREDNGAPVLYLDRIYCSGQAANDIRPRIRAQAVEIAVAMKLPLFENAAETTSAKPRPRRWRPPSAARRRSRRWPCWSVAASHPGSIRTEQKLYQMLQDYNIGIRAASKHW